MSKKTTDEKTTHFKVDSKGRVSLGKYAKGISSFAVKKGENGTLVLYPYTEVPAHEAWLYQNKQALESVERGIQESLSGETQSFDLENL